MTWVIPEMAGMVALAAPAAIAMAAVKAVGAVTVVKVAPAEMDWMATTKTSMDFPAPMGGTVAPAVEEVTEVPGEAATAALATAATGAMVA